MSASSNQRRRLPQASGVCVRTADIPIENNGPVAIDVETRNFPLEGVVQVRIADKFGGARLERAILLGGSTIDLATWRLITPLSLGFSTLQVRATVP